MRLNKASLIKLFSLSAIFIVVAITAFLLNAPRAQASNPGGDLECHWVDSHHIICTWNGGTVKDVLTQREDTTKCGKINTYTCASFYYSPIESKDFGQPVFAQEEGKASRLFFTTGEPNALYYMQGGESPPALNTATTISVAKVSNAKKAAPGDDCSILNPSDCDDFPDNTGQGLDTTAFNEAVNELAELEELSNQCEKQVPLGFIFCPIYKLTTDAITSLIGGSSTSGNRQGLLITFLSVSPLKSEDGSQNVMQVFVGQVVNLANLVYIVVFLLLIFSSSLPLGLDNYTIKKMLPKFIAAVILTQFSYVITQLVIDFFNIMGVIVPNIIFSLGVGTQQIIEATGGVQGGDYSGINQIGTGMGLVFIVGTAGTGPLLIAAFGFILLLILAFIALIALIVAFVYMVLRYLVIYILVIISPFAFVAWVLPGTEKFFFSWWKNFIRVNAVFPMVTGMLAIAVVLSQVIVAGANNNNENGAVGTATQLMAMIIPIVALFMVPKTLKWTTQGMNALAAGALGFAAGKMGAGAQAVGKGAKATGKYAKSAGKDAANDYRAKKAGEMFGRGNKAGGALLMGKLPTSKGTHQAREAAAKAEREVAERNQASLNAEGVSLQGLELHRDASHVAAQIKARNPKMSDQQALTKAQSLITSSQGYITAARTKAYNDVINSGGTVVDANNAAAVVQFDGNDLYGLELQSVAAGGGSSVLGVSAGDRSMQVSAVTELAQRGDFNLIHENLNKGTLSKDVMMKGIQPHFSDVMTKAPDLIKGPAGAFDSISAEKLAALDKNTAKRYVQHLQSPQGAAARTHLQTNLQAQFAADPRLASSIDTTTRSVINNGGFGVTI